LFSRGRELLASSLMFARRDNSTGIVRPTTEPEAIRSAFARRQCEHAGHDYASSFVVRFLVFGLRLTAIVKHTHCPPQDAAGVVVYSKRGGSERQERWTGSRLARHRRPAVSRGVIEHLFDYAITEPSGADPRMAAL
jgi:hypothetical protein